MLTAEFVRTLFDYNSETGVFTRRVSRGKSPAGSIAGSCGSDGYIRIGIDGRSYRAHRLAWLYVNGFWPTSQIDHVNCIRTDNRASNLREATHGENQTNAAAYRNNKIGRAHV